MRCHFVVPPETRWHQLQAMFTHIVSPQPKAINLLLMLHVYMCKRTYWCTLPWIYHRQVAFLRFTALSALFTTPGRSIRPDRWQCRRRAHTMCNLPCIALTLSPSRYLLKYININFKLLSCSF